MKVPLRVRIGLIAAAGVAALAVAAVGTFAVVILFEPKVDYPVGTQPYDVAVGDLGRINDDD